MFLFFFNQKTAYEILISDWSSDVCSSVLVLVERFAEEQLRAAAQAAGRLAKPVPELLFVCVHNAGRSQMAAALAEHLSGGRVHVRTRSEERRVGNECVSTCRSRWSTYD